MKIVVCVCVCVRELRCSIRHIIDLKCRGDTLASRICMHTRVPSAGSSIEDTSAGNKYYAYLVQVCILSKYLEST